MHRNTRQSSKILGGTLGMLSQPNYWGHVPRLLSFGAYDRHVCLPDYVTNGMSMLPETWFRPHSLSLTDISALDDLSTIRQTSE